MNTLYNFVNDAFDDEKPDEYVQLNHYHHKSLIEWVKRIRRGHDTGPNKTIQQWHDTKFDFCEDEDLSALIFFQNT